MEHPLPRLPFWGSLVLVTPSATVRARQGGKGTGGDSWGRRQEIPVKVYGGPESITGRGFECRRTDWEEGKYREEGGDRDGAAYRRTILFLLLELREGRDSGPWCHGLGGLRAAG